MALPQFTKAGNPQSPFTFEKARLKPITEPINPNQIIGKAGGGQVKVADLGDAEQFIYIVINRVSKTNRDNLLTFIQDSTVNYSENTFTFIDENSISYTVRLWNVRGLDFPSVRGGDLYNVRLTLRVEIT